MEDNLKYSKMKDNLIFFNLKTTSTFMKIRPSCIFKKIEVVFHFQKLRLSSIFKKNSVVLQISSSWVKPMLHTKFQLHMLRRKKLRLSPI